MTYRVILLVGCAGSGKSTYSRQQFPDAAIVSADHYFERMAERFNRTYRQVFDVRHLREAHKHCEQEFNAAIARNCPILIVDNTNLLEVDRLRYARIATAHGYQTELHVFSRWLHDGPVLSPEEKCAYVRHCHGRSVHGVPLDVVGKQFDQVVLPSGIYLAERPPHFLRPLLLSPESLPGEY